MPAGGRLVYAKMSARLFILETNLSLSHVHSVCLSAGDSFPSLVAYDHVDMEPESRLARELFMSYTKSNEVPLSTLPLYFAKRCSQTQGIYAGISFMHCGQTSNSVRLLLGEEIWSDSSYRNLAHFSLYLSQVTSSSLSCSLYGVLSVDHVTCDSVRVFLSLARQNVISAFPPGIRYSTHLATAA